MFLLEEDFEEWHDDYVSAFSSSPLDRVFVASSAVMKKVAGLESAEGRIVAAEIDLPKQVREQMK